MFLTHWAKILKPASKQHNEGIHVM